MSPGPGLRTDGRRRPLVFFAAAFMLGLAAGFRWGQPEPWGLAALLGWCLALRFRKQARAEPVFWITLVLLGGFQAALHHPGISARNLGRLIEAPRETVSLIGRVRDDPMRRISFEGARPQLNFTVEAEQLRRILPGWQRCRGRVRIVMYGEEAVLDPPAYGDRVRLDGVLRRERPDRMHLVHSGDIRRLSSGHGWAPIAAAYRWRAAGLRRLARDRDAHPGATGVLQSMLLGHRGDLPARVQDTFRVTGANHILAISGLHVGVICALWIVLLRLAGLPRRLWFFVLAPVLLVYMTAAGLPRSAIRATLMALAYAAAPLVHRRPDALSAVAFAALSILLVNPESLHDPGFIFSFTIVTGLLVLVPPLHARWIGAGTDEIDWAPDGPGFRRRFRRSLVRRLAELVLISGVAWLASIPLMARYTNVFAPVGFIANLLLVPAAFAVVWAGWVSLLLDASFPAAGEVGLAAARSVADGLIRALHALASVPGGHVYLRAPPAGAMVGWYGMLWLLIRGRRWRGAGLAGLVCIGLFSAGLYPGRPAAEVDVYGAAESFGPLVRLRHGPSLLFDPGPAYRRGRAIRRLRSRGVNRLDILVLTRADARHMGAAPDVAAAFRVREVWIPDYAALSRVFRQSMEAMEAQGITIRRLRAGDTVNQCAVAWHVLHPLPESEGGRRAQDNDLVLRMDIAPAGRALLFSGSAGTKTAARLGENEDSSRAGGVDVLISRAIDPVAIEAWIRFAQPDAVIVPLPFDGAAPPLPPTGHAVRLFPLPGIGRIDCVLRGGDWRIRESGKRVDRVTPVRTSSTRGAVPSPPDP